MSDTKESAAERLIALRMRAEEECRAELATVLERHACALVAIPELKPAGGGAFVVAARVVVTSKT
jgi:hypothetical protein